MFQITLENEVAHFHVAMLKRSPVFDQNVSLRQSAAERNRCEGIVDVKTVAVILIVADGILPVACFE